MPAQESMASRLIAPGGAAEQFLGIRCGKRHGRNLAVEAGTMGVRVPPRLTPQKDGARLQKIQELTRKKRSLTQRRKERKEKPKEFFLLVFLCALCAFA
jgi:hypothetical protein